MIRQSSHKASFGQYVKQNYSLYLFIAPYMVLFFVFTVISVVIAMVLSFTQFNILEPPKFVFIDNYLRLFLEDDIFVTSVKNTIILSVIIGPLGYILSFLFAWFINELNPKVRSIVTLVFYAPTIAGNLYYIWGILFSNDSYGYVNAILMKLNIIQAPILWFQDTRYMMTLVIVVALWSSLGTSFLTFIAGLQGVDRSQIEAASVDGINNRWQELWYVILPGMRPQLMFGAVMSITGSFGIGSIITALCGFPSNGYAAHTMVNHLEDYGLQRFEMGYACAIATLLFLLMIGANFFIKRIISKIGE